MLYTLELDENNYVLGILNTEYDNVELDLSKIDYMYLGAYQYINNKLILDKKRKKELEEEEEERKRKEQEPTDFERIEAQSYYTAMLTDTLLEE